MVKTLWFLNVNDFLRRDDQKIRESLISYFKVMISYLEVNLNKNEIKLSHEKNHGKNMLSDREENTASDSK